MRVWFLTPSVLTGLATAFLLGSQVQELPIHAHVSSVVSTPGFPSDGSEITIGLRFVIDDGYRISWKNPGGSGRPPIVTWTVPKSVEVGAIDWPAPSRFVNNGTISYGYEGTVIFPLTLRLRSAAASGQGGMVMMTGHVDYTVCRDTCVNESAKVGLGLSPGAPPNMPSADAAIIADAVARVPKALPSRWSPSAHIAGGELTLEISPGSPESAAAFFPAHAGDIDDWGLQRIEPMPKGFRLHVRTADGTSAPPATLQGVLMLPNRGAFEINVKIR